MTDYLVFDALVEAVVVERVIFNFGVQLATGAGYLIAEDGGIIGKRQGVSDPLSQETTTWDIPRQRLDGKWVVRHPKHHPSAQNEENLALLLGQLGDITVEQEQENWWPE